MLPVRAFLHIRKDASTLPTKKKKRKKKKLNKKLSLQKSSQR